MSGSLPEQGPGGKSLQDDLARRQVYSVRVAIGASQGLFPNGTAYDLKPGMTTMVDIRTGDRKLIQYIFSPCRRRSVMQCERDRVDCHKQRSFYAIWRVRRQSRTQPKKSPVALVARSAKSQILRIFGWGTWIRTKIDRVRVGSSTVELSPTGPWQLPRGRLAGVRGV